MVCSSKVHNSSSSHPHLLPFHFTSLSSSLCFFHPLHPCLVSWLFNSPTLCIQPLVMVCAQKQLPTPVAEVAATEEKLCKGVVKPISHWKHRLSSLVRNPRENHIFLFISPPCTKHIFSERPTKADGLSKPSPKYH